jgi:hypothetical protein
MLHIGIADNIATPRTRQNAALRATVRHSAADPATFTALAVIAAGFVAALAFIL